MSVAVAINRGMHDSSVFSSSSGCSFLLMYTQLHGPPTGTNYTELCEKQVQSVLEKDTNTYFIVKGNVRQRPCGHYIAH